MNRLLVYPAKKEIIVFWAIHYVMSQMNYTEITSTKAKRIPRYRLMLKLLLNVGKISGCSSGITERSLPTTEFNEKEAGDGNRKRSEWPVFIKLFF